MPLNSDQAEGGEDRRIRHGVPIYPHSQVPSRTLPYYGTASVINDSLHRR